MNPSLICSIKLKARCLELLTGRKAIDTTRPNDEQNLVTWAQLIFRDPKRFPDMADSRLNNNFPLTSLNQAVEICATCLQVESFVQPLIGDVAALSFLAIPQPSTGPASAPPADAPPSEQKMLYEIETKKNKPSQSDDSLWYDDSESTQSGSDQRNGGSYQKVEQGEKDNSSLYSGIPLSGLLMLNHLLHSRDFR